MTTLSLTALQVAFVSTELLLQQFDVLLRDIVQASRTHFLLQQTEADMIRHEVRKIGEGHLIGVIFPRTKGRDSDVKGECVFLYFEASGYN